MMKETKFYCEVEMEPDIALTVLHSNGEEDDVVVKLELGDNGENGTVQLTSDEFKDFCKVVTETKKSLADG